MQGSNLNCCRALLLKEFANRQAKNPLYSLRAFARDLGIGSTSLSDNLASKRQLSKTNLKKVSERLSLSPIQSKLLFDELKGVRTKSDVEANRLLIEEDSFRLIADWYYFAILSLSKLSSNRASVSWISSRIGISGKTVKEALDRLIRLNLIEVKKGKMIRTSEPISTTRDVSSIAIRKHHQGNLDRAEKSLLNDEISKREFSSVTMAINPSKLPEAKNLLMNTKRRISKLLESKNASEVYTLSFQLFPLTRSIKMKESLI